MVRPSMRCYRVRLRGMPLEVVDGLCAAIRRLSAYRIGSGCELSPSSAGSIMISMIPQAFVRDFPPITREALKRSRRWRPLIAGLRGEVRQKQQMSAGTFMKRKHWMTRGGKRSLEASL